MDALGWLVAYVAGFGLLQLLLYRYFRREDPSPDTTPSVDGAAQSAVERSTDGEQDGIHCQYCGRYNENVATFSYCKNCVSPL